MILPYTKDEFTKEMEMDYKELVSYLQGKYGSVKGDYFLTPTCKSKNKNITRTKDGLYVHHIAEDKYINIGNPAFALTADFCYQKKDYLVYCNYFEHLILHFNITLEVDPDYILESGQNVGIGGLYNFLIPEANLFYSRAIKDKSYEVDTQEWRKNCHMCLRENEDLYHAFLTCMSCIPSVGLYLTLLTRPDFTEEEQKEYWYHIGSTLEDSPLSEKVFNILISL